MNTATPSEPTLKGIRGQLITFKADPFLNNGNDCYDYYTDALVIIQDDKIIEVGDYAKIITNYPTLKDIDAYDDAVIMPGFIDCHAHYVQSPMIGSSGATLLDWLNRYTFPTESKFKDKTFADDVAKIYFKQLLKHGTTTANVFATTFETSVDAFFEESESYNTRMISGKVLQDRNLPDYLKDISAEKSITLTEQLLNKWHHRGRQLYAIMPRFAPTSTPAQLAMAGELYRQYIDDGVYMHTHLDEAENEIEWVKSLYPEAKNYTAVYQNFGLVGPRSIFAHCCLVTDEEWHILADNGCGVIHCPSSNLFLGDGEFKFWEAKNPAHPCHVGIGTDVGGGTNFSILRQLNEAYKVAMLHMKSLDAVRSFYLATRGGAEALSLENVIGSISPGFEADITVIDLKPSEFLSWRMQFSENIFDRLFILQTLAPDNMNRATYVAGKKVFDRTRERQFMYASDFNL